MENTFYDFSDYPAELQQDLDLLDALKARIDEGKALFGQSWVAIQEKLRADWTYHSNAIEGSSLSREETLFFLKKGLTVEGKPFKDFLDARNHAEAIDWLAEVMETHRLITPGLIKEINALLLSGVQYTPVLNEAGQKIRKPATPGKYKLLPNHVLKTDGTIHFYTDPIHVPQEMDNLCRWINDNMEAEHPLVVGAIAHYNMLRIHPFDDGNGRGTRIVMNLILMKRGYPVGIIRNEKRRKYLDALNRADNGDILPFLKLAAEALLDTANAIVEEFCLLHG